VTATVGAAASRIFEVLDIDTAASLGSGSLPVLGTPRLLAWLEAATVSAVEPMLEPGQTTVGIRVELDHLAPSPLAVHVTVRVTLVEVVDRRLGFDVSATNADGIVAARGRIVRAIVDRERFLAR